MLLYYITDRKQFPGTDRDQRMALVHRVSEAASTGVDYIQLREKDLSVVELERLAREVLHAIRERSNNTRLLINSRTDVAIAVGADGVHLTSTDIAASDARAIWATSDRSGGVLNSKHCVVAASCHSIQEVRLAESHGADFVVLAPIFEKSGTRVAPLGLKALKHATRGQNADFRVEAGDNRVGVPTLALGGVTLLNAGASLRAGAAGVAGIRLFQEGNLKEIVRFLREVGLGFAARAP